MGRILSGALLIAVFASAACAERPRYTGVTMPSPDGCYVGVWDGNGYTGGRDFINGPARYSNLRDLPGGRVWTNRIRSLRAGPAATLVVWTDENFQGRSLRVKADEALPSLIDGVTAQIESMEINCEPAKAE